jgi:hypothetical protein
MALFGQSDFKFFIFVHIFVTLPWIFTVGRKVGKKMYLFLSSVIFLVKIKEKFFWV